MESIITLNSEDRCPHCQVKKPLLTQVYCSKIPLPRSDGGNAAHWAAFWCRSCGSLVVAKLNGIDHSIYYEHPSQVFPKSRRAHEDIPEIARRFLQQAIDTLHAPDASAVMAGSAVDSMLKDMGYVKGSLYGRIDEALSDGIITKAMADWAHSVRLGSNRPRHADQDNPHVSSNEAKQSVEFATALGDFLFVLTAKIKRGLQAATPEKL